MTDPRHRLRYFASNASVVGRNHCRVFSPHRPPRYNRIYLGELTFRGITATGCHPAIIDDAGFGQAQRILAARGQDHSRLRAVRRATRSVPSRRGRKTPIATPDVFKGIDITPIIDGHINYRKVKTKTDKFLWAVNGKLTPAAVVEAATAVDHPLHDRFEWDDAVAGRKYRLQQARELIRVVKETYVDRSGNPAETNYFVSRPTETGRAYDPAREVASDEFASKLILQSMEHEWRTLRRRYERFGEFRELVLRDLQGEVA